jgi:hypothetical protein
MLLRNTLSLSLQYHSRLFGQLDSPLLVVFICMHLYLCSNHWDYPSEIVSVEDTSMVGGGYVLKQHIWNAARDTIQEWTGQQLAECSLYGIRVYKEGSILATHVDRLPLVSSAIINVDQDVDEPWYVNSLDVTVHR